VNIGTAALENPEWCEKIIAEHGDRVAIGLDTRQVDGEWRLRGRGWVSDGGDLWEVLERLDSQGCSRFVVTDVSRDGMLNGPNIDLLRDVAAATSAPVVASGGISSLDDIRALAGVADEGVDSAIVGKALYANKFTLEEALAVTREEAQAVPGE
ncbi:MAG: HisA/HisF-related TIM barrel protein, partial [Corynebacterium sp.]|nr:HisA/HisF-related TIM barrel protein [Corynebacterium sp.]